MDLNDLQQKINNYITVVSSWVRNVGKLYFSGTAEDVTVQLIDDNGNVVDTTLPNVAQFRKRVWDDVGAALGQFNRTVYVDEINGDDNNTGLSTSPFKTVPHAISICPHGGTITIIMLSDCSFRETVYKVGSSIRINLNGHKLGLEKMYVDGKAVLYSIEGYNNTVYFYGNYIEGSAVEIPALGDDTLYGPDHSVFIKSNGYAEPEFSQVDFSYGVELIDNGDFYIASCSNSSCAFSFATNCTFTAKTGSRVVTDLVSGIIRDTNGVPRNIQSNLIF